jgi:mono/diheme cytochrome c family protein
MRLLYLVVFLASLYTSCRPITTKTDNEPTQSVVTTRVTPSSVTPSHVQLTDKATISRVIIATLDLSATIDVRQASAPEISPALAAEGLQIYRDQYCGICHQSTAAATGGTFGPTHDGLATVAAQRIQDSSYHGTATTVAGYLHESLIEPRRYIVPGYELTPHSMPSYSFLTAQQLDALVQFLHQQ